jgi:putative lipoprotein
MTCLKQARSATLVLLLFLAGCQTTEQRLVRQITQLSGTAWKAERIRESPVADGVDSTLEFAQEGDVAGSTGCNVYVSQVLVEQRSIRFTEVMKAGVKCPPEAQDQEKNYIKALGSARQMETGRERLVLRDENGKSVLQLRRLPKLRW